jgi:hypothetical protein
MMDQGQMIAPKYYDDDYIHVQSHRQAQITQAATPGTEQYAQMLEMHIMMHLEQAQLKKPGMSSAAGSVPAMQGGHGIEAQSGALDMQGLAQNPGAPAPNSQGGAVGAPQGPRPY